MGGDVGEGAVGQPGPEGFVGIEADDLSGEGFGVVGDPAIGQRDRVELQTNRLQSLDQQYGAVV